MRNGISRDERTPCSCSLNEIVRLLVPATDEIKVFVFREKRKHVGSLFRIQPCGTQERRIAEDVVGMWPVHRERVGADDVRGVLDRDTGEILPKAVGHLHVAKMVHEPQGDLGDLGWERLDLDAIELRHVHLA